MLGPNEIEEDIRNIQIVNNTITTRLSGEDFKYIIEVDDISIYDNDNKIKKLIHIVIEGLTMGEEIFVQGLIRAEKIYI